MEHHAPLFARQPIFDRDLNVVAYELLFRGGIEPGATTRGDEATSQVLLYAFGRYRIEDITGNLPAYINFTRHWVVFPPALPPQQVVVEVLEDVPPDPGVLEGLKQLRARGYRIALDDFFISRQSRAFIEFADVIKIDVLALSKQQLEKYVEYLRPMGVQLLAEKIENHAVFERCRHLGFDFFQGYFLSKPHIIEGKRIGEPRQALLRELAWLISPDTDQRSLAAHLTQKKHSAACLARIVQLEAPQVADAGSLLVAIRVLGLSRVKDWLLLALLMKHEAKPQALWSQSLARAKFCELVCLRLEDPHCATVSFSTGLLSTLDAVLDLPMDYVVAHLNLPAEIAKGLLEKSGVAGCALGLIEQLETADWQSLSRSPLCETQCLTDDGIAEDYSEALAWSQTRLEILLGDL